MTQKKDRTVCTQSQSCKSPNVPVKASDFNPCSTTSYDIEKVSELSSFLKWE